MSKKRRKTKKKLKKSKRIKSRKKVRKLPFKKRIIKRRRNAKSRKSARKARVKFKIRPKVKLPKITFKVSKFNPLKKFSVQKIVDWLLQPIFKAYDNYRENKRIKKMEEIASEKKQKEIEKRLQAKLRLEEKKKELQFERKLETERRRDLKRVLSEGQALLRREQALERRKLYERMQIQRRLDQFAKREEKEIASLERYALREQISEYRGVQESIDKIRKKYQEIREAKIRENYKSMGIEVEASDTKEDLYEKHRIFEEKRRKVEQVLESFFRSAQSLIFQLNRRWIPKNFEILRVIDRRWEENLFYIRLDNEIEENWLMLIYLEDQNPDKQTIVVEDKTGEKYITKKFNTNSIFSYSDWMVDRWTQFLDREFKKKKAS
ncbi:hypothetical protein OAJ18_01215 [Pelagibacteraceae bacterium]|nr:hypothetical protein [Pelagibacteraceae bacterium]